MDYLMGIDLGSTNLKAVVYDLEGNAVAAGSRKTELVHPDQQHPQWAVWQPEQIWGSTAAAVQDALAQLDDRRAVRAVAVTGMGMDGVPIDRNGRWLYPFISWHDPRTAPQLQWWQEHIGAEKSFATGGNPLWAINSALRILWMSEHEPAILEQTDKWLLIEDFLNFMLCGRKATDYSMASNTLLFDQHKLDWSEEMLSASGIDRRLLPDPFPSGTPLGKVHAEAAGATGLSEGTPVILGGHDHICGTLPVGAFLPGVVLDVVGTWESVLIAMDRPNLTTELQRTGMMVQAHVARGRYAAAGTNPSAGMLEWYRQQYGDQARQKAQQEGDGEGDWEHLMAAAAASPPGARRVMFLPHMSGATCPVVDDRSLGAFVGLSNIVTSGDMLRAMIEGLNYQFLDIVTAVETAAGATPEKFIAVGGVTRNRFLMQNKADVVGRPIEVPAIEEASPLGAAILAGIGVGLYKDEQEAFARVGKPGKIYQPDTELSQEYAERFEIYRQLYPALRPIHHRL